MGVLFFTDETKKKLENDEVKYPEIRIDRYNKNSDTYRTISENEQEMWAGPNGIIISKDAGMMISGAVGFSEPFSSMKYGSVFRGNPMTSTNLPSTINTPIPMFVYDFPFRNLRDLMLSPIMKTIATIF